MEQHHSDQEQFKLDNPDFLAYTYEGPLGLTAMVYHTPSKQREIQVITSEDVVGPVYQELLTKLKTHV